MSTTQSHSAFQPTANGPEGQDVRLRRRPGQPGDRLSERASNPIGSSIRPSPSETAPARIQRWTALLTAHSWLAPLIVCLAVPLAYLLHPSPSNPLHAALFVSYPLPPDPDGLVQYGKGAKDLAFVAFYVVLLTFTREFCMQVLLKPLAVRAGIRPEARRVRFMEQAYTAMYFAVFGPFGLYVMSRTDVWFFDTAAMYEGLPHLTHDALFKAYYLLQAAYWAQQMVVLLLMLEKPRKDFKELVAHHIITLSLIWLSYNFHFMRIGLVVYITHDVSDFFLATSKVVNYLDTPVDIPFFLLSMASWIYLRHYHNLRILSSMLPLASPFPDHVTEQLASITTKVITSAHTSLSPILPPSAAASLAAYAARLHTWLNTPSQYASVGPFALNWDAQQYKSPLSQWITFALLAALQAVNVFWCALMFRVLWRGVRTLGRERVDERSVYDEDEVRADEGGDAPVFVDAGKSAAEVVRFD